MYDDSTYKGLVDFNDPSVLLWAANVYDKLKGHWILPRYIKRTSTIDRVNLIGEGVFDDSFDYTFDFSFYEHILEDSNFTFGWKKDPAYTPGFSLEREVNLGKVHTIEFELSEDGWEDGSLFYKTGDPEPDFNLFDFYYAAGGESLGFTVEEDFDFVRVKIVRANESVKLYLDDVLIGEKFLTNNYDLVFDTLAVGTFPVGNIKVTRGDKILRWWKLNSPFDEGYNDQDFYYFWYSVCYMFAIIRAYTDKWKNISESPVLTTKFIESRGIYYTQNLD